MTEKGQNLSTVSAGTIAVPIGSTQCGSATLVLPLMAPS